MDLQHTPRHGSTQQAGPALPRHVAETPPQHRSFEAMVIPHLPTLTNMARRFTHDAGLAQDLVQETLLRAYRFTHRFTPGTNFRAWLATIMRNLFISQRRKQFRHLENDGAPHAPASAPHPAIAEPDVAQLADLTVALPHLVTDDVFQALQTLSAHHRAAVLLADVLDYSYEDIAAMMHCPLGTVMSRLHRGRQKLRASLHPYATAQGYVRPPHHARSPRVVPTPVRTHAA